MVVRRLRTSKDITRAVLEVDHDYEEIAKAAAASYVERSWGEVVGEHEALFSAILSA
jgi:hypothetical protein